MPPQSGDSKPALGSEARNLLIHHKVTELKERQHVAILVDTCTVEQALTVLASRKIVSAPVVVAPAGHPESEPLLDPSIAADILGFVDIRDMLDSFLAEVDIAQLNECKLLQRMRVLEEKGFEFAERRLKDLKILGTDGDFIHASQANSTLWDLVVNGLLQPRHLDSGPGRVVHRIALFDNSGRITSIISQSDIIRFLVRHRTKLGDLANVSVDDLGLISHVVEGVHPETPAVEAMKLMSEKRLSSLAVLDADGKILGNFSISDMRTIVSEHFGALALPVGEFLAQEHHTEYVSFNRLHEEGLEGTAGHKFVRDRVSRQRPRTPGDEVGQALVLARPSNTLPEVMEKMVKRRVHRLWCVDDGEIPIGIITCTDILRKLLEVGTR